MEKSLSIANIAKSFASFQEECPNPTLDKTVKVTPKGGGAGYSFKYSTFGQILDVAKPILAKHKLSFTQMVESDGSVTTMLMHESGEWFSANFLIKGESTPQGIGSAVSYAKRYALAAMLGLAAEEDDDGNIAQGNTHELSEDKRAFLNPGTAQWTEAIKYLQGDGTIDKIKTKYKISKVNEEKLKEATLQSA